MKIKMLKDKAATANQVGSISMTYEKGVTYDMNETWSKNMANTWIENGVAEEIGKIEKKIVKPKETKKETKKSKVIKVDIEDKE
tara:strand:- start:548 stop:799 length:252 start_codon:yes stop_codon:yes gene_type:complete